MRPSQTVLTNEIDNATKFVSWIASQESGALKGVNYAVFGCGNRKRHWLNRKMWDGREPCAN